MDREVPFPKKLAANNQPSKQSTSTPPSIMEFATVALCTLLPKLAELLKEEYDLQKGTKKGIKFLNEELERMHAALHEVGEVPLEELSKLVRLWARDVREVSYDMEDITDTFIVRVQGTGTPSKRSVKRFIKKMANMFTEAKTRREIAEEIKGIKERVKQVADRRDRYKLDAIASAKETPVDPRLKALYTKMTELVGIDMAKEEVITRLMRKGEATDERKRIVVSIAGFGGIGKTTLAKAVHDVIKKDFDCTAFVSVSRNPDTKKLLKDLLYELDDKEFKNIHNKKLDERLLINKAIEFLDNKRYLIVIDDIWDKKPWDEVIGHALQENNMRSRIIITTRIIDVAEHLGGLYNLQPLSDESSEMLFYGRIFGSEVSCPMKFSEVSKKILKKCGGVPLAIVTISSLLANKLDNVEEWFNVCKSIGSGVEGNPDMARMRKILLLSYYDLPSHLKTCLLYLRVFPEDYEIGKDGLISRWVAEGFVQQRQQGAGVQSFLEIGESYFNELIRRSLIQPSCIDEKGTPRACRVHDTVLDFLNSLLDEEECFVTTVLDDGMWQSSERMQQVRWLSLHYNNNTWPTMKMPKLRSLTIFKSDGVLSDLTLPSLSRYLFLRVLDLRGFRLKDLASLKFVGSLSHLRYLGLSSSTDRYRGDLDAVDQLPVEIGKLQFLQTLDVTETTVEEVPPSVVRGLGHLICLHGCGGGMGYLRGTRLPDGLKNLTSLEVLESAILTSGCIAGELGHLTQLRVLDVIVTRDDLVPCAKALVESIGKLTKIESLRITYVGYGVDLNGSMGEALGKLRRVRIGTALQVPTWIEPVRLDALSYLDIVVWSERREDIQVLGTLPCLSHLKFEVLFDPEEDALERCAVGPRAFPCAVRCEFFIYGGGGVVPCMFPPGAMPRLEHYTFNMGRYQFWGGGESLVKDLALGHLPSLRSVTFHDTPGYKFEDDMVKSVREKLEHEAAAHHNHPRIFII
ncbi:unnamed protein product [Urochloa decumbens]|uniref:Uncharacterized protein n=1 Tax=Urochloa decumbens TaxID=240449 RepID=A0ABC9C0Y1_9POAL